MQLCYMMSGGLVELGRHVDIIWNSGIRKLTTDTRRLEPQSAVSVNRCGDTPKRRGSGLWGTTQDERDMRCILVNVSHCDKFPIYGSSQTYRNNRRRARSVAGIGNHIATTLNYNISAATPNIKT